MTHTISHRHGTVPRAQVGGLLRHNYRDVDRMNDRETNHSNERIDPMRTMYNESVMYRDGEALPMSSSAEVLEELDRRLETVHGTRTNRKTGETKKIALRKDAGVVREIVMTLDPKYSRSSHYMVEDQENGNGKHAEKIKGHFRDMIDFYADVYGRENLLASSLHLDETTPHVHLWVTPIAEVEGIRTIKQAAFIGDGRGPDGGMGRNDKAMREWMTDKGYDVDPEPRRITTKNMSAEELAALEKLMEELDGRQVEMEDRETELTQRETELQEADKQVSELADYASSTMAKVGQREVGVKRREDAWLEWNDKLKQRDKQVKEEEAELPKVKARAVEEGRKEGFDQGVEEGRSEIEKAVEQERFRLITTAQADARAIRVKTQEQADELREKYFNPETFQGVVEQDDAAWMRWQLARDPELRKSREEYHEWKAERRQVNTFKEPEKKVTLDSRLQATISKQQQHGRDRDDGFQPGM